MNSKDDGKGIDGGTIRPVANGVCRRRFLGSTLATVAVTTLGFPAIVRAQEEKRVVLYCPESPDLSSKIAKAFEAETGIAVNVQYGGTNVIVNRLLAERANPNADVWYGGGGLLSFLYAKREGITTPYTPPEFKDVPVQQGNVYLRDPDWHFVGAEVFVIGFAYNPKVVPEGRGAEDMGGSARPQVEGPDPDAQPCGVRNGNAHGAEPDDGRDPKGTLREGGLGFLRAAQQERHPLPGIRRRAHARSREGRREDRDLLLVHAVGPRRAR